MRVAGRSGAGNNDKKETTMKSNKLTYILKPVSEEFTGGAKVFRAVVQTNGTVDQDQLAAALAEKTKLDPSLIQYFLLALDEELTRQILAGFRVNLGQLSTGFVIRGSFTSEDDRFDAKRHTILPTVRTLDPLKSALNAIGAENITVGLSCSVISLMDAVTHEQNCITGSHEVHIQGVNLGISTDNPDEGVSLVDGSGAVVATATVESSDPQIIICTFATPPAPGDYTLVVACRNGNRESLAPAIGRIPNITVKAA